MPRAFLFAAAAFVIASAAPLAARDSLGIYGNWGAFMDRAEGQCYAIATAERGKSKPSLTPYADVATWPRKGVRGQVHFRLSEPLAKGAAVSLAIGGRYLRLTGAGTNAWAVDAKGDATIVAAMRSAETMTVRAIAANGRRIADRYRLPGVASALDAATVGCARLR